MIEIDGAITDATVAEVRAALADPERRDRDGATTSGSDASISATTSCAGHCRSSSRRVRQAATRR